MQIFIQVERINIFFTRLGYLRVMIMGAWTSFIDSRDSTFLDTVFIARAEIIIKMTKQMKFGILYRK